MKNIPLRPNKNSTLYKTTIFRGGKLYLEKKDRFYKEKFKQKVKNKFYENMPIDNMIKFIEQNKENLFPRISKKNTIICDDSQENDSKKGSQYNSLYKKLMSKKEELLDNLMNNKINEYNKVVIHHNPHQRNISYLNNSNHSISSIIPQNNSLETNILNNSSVNKINNSNNNNFNNSSKNITNFSSYSNLLLKKKNDGIPILFPIVYSTFVKCNSVSQNSRYQNIMGSFIKVKTFIENDKKLGKENEFDYIKEFLISKKIDQKHINPDNLKNFSKFLQCENIPIDLNKSLKENIIMGLYFDEKKYKIKSRNNNEKKEFSIDDNHKYYNNKILLKQKRKIEQDFRQNQNNYKSLVLDLSRQKKLYENDEDKNENKLRDELQKEVKMVENEIQNKQKIIEQVEKKLNLTSIYYNYNNSLKLNKIKNEKKEPKSIELKLASTQQINRRKLNKRFRNEKKTINNANIYDSNERLYYSWYRDKKRVDIYNFVKKIKLTEFIMYNKVREKALKEKLWAELI